MSVQVARVRNAFLAMTATILFASAARAQDDNTLALGVSFTARAADGSGAHGSQGIGVAWRFRHSDTGWGWTGGLGWFASDIDRSVGGQTIEIGEVHVKPLMAGYGYTYSFGRTSWSAELIGGYAFVSFDQGKHWQSLQQNLPATPVTDFKVHHGDLLASTMGRSFWVMDDVAPLRQLAASVTKPARSRTTDSPNQAGAIDITRAGPRAERGACATVRDLDALESAQPTAAKPPIGQGARPAQGSRAALASSLAIKPFDGSNVFLFTPAPAYRVRADRLLPRRAVGRPEARDPRRGGHRGAQLYERDHRRAAA